MIIKTVHTLDDVKGVINTLKKSVVKRVWVQCPSWDAFQVLNDHAEIPGNYCVLPVDGLHTPTSGYKLGVFTLNTDKHRKKTLDHIKTKLGALPMVFGVTENTEHHEHVPSPGHIQDKLKEGLDDFVPFPLEQMLSIPPQK